MLKRFLGVEVYRLLSSTIELPLVPFSVFSVAERGFMSELYGLGVIRGAWPLAFANLVADLCWGRTYWCPSSPIRLDDFVLCRLRAAGDTARRFAVVIDRGHIDPVKNGDAFETVGNMTTLADGKDTVKCCDILS